MSNNGYDAEYLEILLQGSVVWNDWSKKNPDVRPNFVRADLSGADLSDCDLRQTFLFGANLSGANLNRVNLENVRMERATLRGAHLEKACLNRVWLDSANLSDATLRRAQMSEARMNFTNLRGADLSGAMLPYTKLQGADLTGATMIDARLSSTDLRGACLRGVNLHESWWQDVVFERTDLKDSDWSEAHILNLTFGAVDLGQVRGLESVEHLGPSLIGLETGLASHGPIPGRFLLGCGVPVEVVENVATLSPLPVRSRSCFLYYWHEDEAFALQLHDGLREWGIYCWLQENSILDEPEYSNYMEPVHKLWQPVLVCASQKSLASTETYYACIDAIAKEAVLQKTQEQTERLLMVLDLDGFVFEGFEHRNKEEIQSHVVASFKGWETNNKKLLEGLEVIMKVLRADVGREYPPKLLL